jgi:hypothetical protein
MNVETLLKWAKAATILRQKYDLQKENIMINIKEQKRIIPFHYTPFLDLISKRQIPLYNNIVNYSNLALGMVSDPNAKKQIALFIKYGYQIREGLNIQMSIIINTNPENQKKSIKTLKKVWKQEKKLVAKLEAKTILAKEALVKSVNVKLSEIAAVTYVKTPDSILFLKRNKKALLTLRIACMAVMSLGILVGTGYGDIPKQINRITEFLTGVS